MLVYVQYVEKKVSELVSIKYFVLRLGCYHYLVFYPAYSREELIKEIVSYEENFQQKVCPINTVVI